MKNYKYNKILACIIVITMTLLNNSKLVAHEQKYDVISVLYESLKSDIESVDETMKDAASKMPSAGDWRCAVFRDHFWWNSFHKAVQNYIVNSSNNQVQKVPEEETDVELETEIDEEPDLSYVPECVYD